MSNQSSTLLTEEQPDSFLAVPLTQGEVALVDPSDYPLVSAYSWCCCRGQSGIIYAASAGGLRMHRLIMQPPDDMEVDHKNRNGLDNRRSNLRICTHSQNMWNTKKQGGCSSKYKGVTWLKKYSTWCAYTRRNNRRLHLGYYLCEEDAAIAYDYAAVDISGEFALTNAAMFPELAAFSISREELLRRRYRPSRIPRGERRPDAKLTDDVVRSMRLRRSQGETIASLSSEAGVSYMVAKRAIIGQSWKHVT